MDSNNKRDGHGRRSGTYFQGWTPDAGNDFLGQYNLDGIQLYIAVNFILREIRNTGATRRPILSLKGHEIQFLLGISTRDPAGELTALPHIL